MNWSSSLYSCVFETHQIHNKNMADSSVLTLQSNSAEQGTIMRHDQPQFTSLDEVMEQGLASFGSAQFMQAVLVCVPQIFDAQQAFISVYSDAIPTRHCTDSTSCNSSSDICSLPIGAWAWDGPLHKSIISEWGLECATSIITGLPSSAFFMGCLVGGFCFATLGDSRLGRKKLVFFSCFAMSLAALLTIFSPNIWVYSSLRFVTGFFRSSIVTTALVLSTGRVGKRWRGRIGIMGFFFFSLGLLSLPLMAYVNRYSSWRTLFVWTSIPSILYCIMSYFFVSESPRWLFMQGRKVEAIAVLKKLSARNSDSSNLCISVLPVQEELPEADIFASMKNLLKRKWALRRLLAVMTLGFGAAMVYFGMLLGVGNLGLNTYLSFAFNGILDVLCYFLTVVIIERCNRRSSMLVFSMASGVCSIICGTVTENRGIQIGFELASFFSSCTVSNLVLISATELFPTSVRNSATSMVRQAIIFSAVISPLLISVGRRNVFLCYGVFGIVLLCSGFFVVCLPETRGRALCDTLEEQERQDNAIRNVM